MGLIGDWIGRVRIGDPVPGTAQVVSCSQWVSDNASSANCGMTLVVHAEGIEPFSREYSCLVKPERWPFPGQALPVTVDRRNPQRMRVDWDRVETSDERARRQAHAMVAALRGQAQASVVASAGAIAGDGTDINEKLEALRRLGELRDSGVLTEQEFAEQKARLLGQEPVSE